MSDALRTRRQIQANGLGRCVELRGPEKAPTVLLAHSLACSHEMWRPQIEALAGDHRIVAYDLRGHGRDEGYGTAGRPAPGSPSSSGPRICSTWSRRRRRHGC